MNEPITRVEAYLQGILNKMDGGSSGGGTTVMANMTPITRLERYLQDILNKMDEGGGGSGLPEVTSEDNGDFLRVVDGAWAKATVPSAESEAY